MTIPFLRSAGRRAVNSGIGIASIFLLAGCMQTQATMMDSSLDLPRVHPDDVRLYRSEASIECEFDEVALIHAQGSTSFTNEKQMIKAARKRAARVGANGLILTEIDEPGAGAKVAGAVLGVDTERRGEMVAVYVHKPCGSTRSNAGN